MRFTIVDGDLLNQSVEVIVNAWNRNLIPWWLLLPQGVSGAIKKRGGVQPFNEVRRFGMMPLGSAVLTGAGRLPYKGIIHVAGIDMLWRSTEDSVRDSVLSAMKIVNDHGFNSVAFPVIGAGSGGLWGLGQKKALVVMEETLSIVSSDAKVIVVVYKPQ